MNPDPSLDEPAVREANQAFYTALQLLSLEQMDTVWHQDEGARCVHPGWEILQGWEEIRKSWENIFRNTRRMGVRLREVSVQGEGDLAWVCCVEDITYASDKGFGTARVGATNIFLRRNGRWLMVQHHTSPLPASTDESLSVQ